MPGNLRDINELESELDGLGFRGMSKQNYLDILRSLAKVAGVMNINKGVSPAQDITIAAGWNRVDVWEVSRDTQGVQDGLQETIPEGWFKVKNQGSGDYTCTATMRFTADTAGTYEIRVEKVEADGITITDTLWQDAVTVGAGEEGHLAIGSALIKNVLKNEKLQLSIKGPNLSVVTITYAQFGVSR